jgi:hypothetical protein
MEGMFRGFYWQLGCSAGVLLILAAVIGFVVGWRAI